jgi:hypothetical protein
MLITSSVPKNRVSQPQVLLQLRAVPRRLEQRGQEREPDHDRHEEEVVDRGEGELYPGEVDVHRLPPREGSVGR